MSPPSTLVVLDPDRIPEALRPLIALATSWGSLETEGAQLDRIAETSDDELRALIDAVAPHIDAIDDWFDSFPPDRVTTEAWHFQYLARAHDLASYRFETPPDPQAIESAKRDLADARDSFDEAMRRLDDSDDDSI